MQCTNNLKQLGLAVHNFHDTNLVFPGSSHQTAFADRNNPGDPFHQARSRWSYLTAILPQIEQNALYDVLLSEDYLATFQSYNNNVSGVRNTLTTTQLTAIHCPSDTAAKVADGQMTHTSYHCNRGDQWIEWSWNESRGVFGPAHTLQRTFASLTDGSSNTMMISEAMIAVPGSREVGKSVAIDMGAENSDAPGTCLARVGANNIFTGNVNHTTGRRWCDTYSPWTLWHPMLPPNGPSCGNGSDTFVMQTASSYHPGGVNVVFCDGAVKFIPDTIDAGDPNLTVFDSPVPVTNPDRPQDYAGPSLYGVWGALGSISGKETASVP